MSDFNNLSVSDLVALLVQASDKEIDEFNAVYDHCEVLSVKLNELKKENERLLEVEKKFKILEEQCDTVYNNGEKHLSLATQAYRERDQMADKLATTNELLKKYKELGTPAKIREKIKGYQTKTSDAQDAIKKLKETIKANKDTINSQNKMISDLKANEIQSNLTSVWSENGDNLMVFPTKLSMQVGEHQEKQLTLLYMTSSGCGKLIALDEDGEPAVCNFPEDMTPKARTLDVAGQILRKWKRQNWKLEISDLDLQSK